MCCSRTLVLCQNHSESNKIDMELHYCTSLLAIEKQNREKEEMNMKKGKMIRKNMKIYIKGRNFAAVVL